MGFNTSSNRLMPSGRQIAIARGDQRATITSVGATLREYAVADRDVIVPFGEEEVCPVCHGQVLLPWPNRLGDGAFVWEGQSYQLPINEVGRHNAIHGLVRWHEWRVRDVTADAVSLELSLPPTDGWPFQLHSVITHRLTSAGLEISLAVQNTGQTAAPLGIGFHPWLSTGGTDLDDCDVQVDAATHITVDERLLPIGRELVTGTYDLRFPRGLKGRDLDDAWTDVGRDESGKAWAKLFCPDGHTPAVWMDESLLYWQICSANDIDERERFGLACEPMTCAADVFNTGENLVTLLPGHAHKVLWGLTLF